ncbi:MAG: zinc metalloprotease [Marmoricola sp.]|nr:zinc metalloprotease [Marmoricola sp.]
MRRARRTAVTVIAAAAALVAVAPLTATSAASATTGSTLSPRSTSSLGAGFATAATCLSTGATDQVDGSARSMRSERFDPVRARRETPVSAADLSALPAAQSRPGFVRREVAPTMPARVTIPVYVHVIKGTHRGETNPFGPRRVAKLLSILNGGFSGGQSPDNVATRYSFVLKRTDYTKRDAWYHAYLNGTRDQQAKHALHRGGAGSLNLYLNGGGSADEGVLGWSRFPWQYASNPKQDNVSVNIAATPGGSARGYNLGDTVIHETGHWMGLFHTFQGGCGSQGDLVADTAAEDEPSFYCETTRDTCVAPGFDPVHNFMDYSYDSCMNMFTAGQVSRMDAAFEKYRS